MAASVEEGAGVDEVGQLVAAGLGQEASIALVPVTAVRGSAANRMAVALLDVLCLRSVV